MLIRPYAHRTDLKFIRTAERPSDDYFARVSRRTERVSRLTVFECSDLSLLSNAGRKYNAVSRSARGVRSFKCRSSIALLLCWFEHSHRTKTKKHENILRGSRYFSRVQFGTFLRTVLYETNTNVYENYSAMSTVGVRTNRTRLRSFQS